MNELINELMNQSISQSINQSIKNHIFQTPVLTIVNTEIVLTCFVLTESSQSAN